MSEVTSAARSDKPKSPPVLRVGDRQTNNSATASRKAISLCESDLIIIVTDETVKKP